MKTHQFKTETVLSITHDRLLTDIGEVYEILNYMLNDNVPTPYKLDKTDWL